MTNASDDDLLESSKTNYNKSQLFPRLQDPTVDITGEII